MKIKAIALDDEPLALDIIKAYLKDVQEVTLKETFTNQYDAINYLQNNSIDLLFLDIEMPGFNGIELYKSLKSNTKVIFTTAYSEYAIEGFNVNAIDYLLKPIAKDRFMVALQKATQTIHSNSKEKATITYLNVKVDYKIKQISLNEILFIESLDDYVRIHLKDNTNIVTRTTLKSMLEKLPETQFMRVHRSYIVAIDKLSSYYKQTIKIGDFTIPVSETYKKALTDIFNI
ncbi:DNA-binding response regulator [Neptunitalea chrysea]|uniref:DNA-binding response regulator n=1 Tax=Neptunitalea chrysea TaxID=1647581 RepID=A0A9W6B6F2_9FLAO|nr:LytTR family DNA-binding domain-containing protein [Neptunitalea chrysea]GLB52455.1 DNA-binding response regulator [Neptunitalea chrysea]